MGSGMCIRDSIRHARKFTQLSHVLHRDRQRAARRLVQLDIVVLGQRTEGGRFEVNGTRFRRRVHDARGLEWEETRHNRLRDCQLVRTAAKAEEADGLALQRSANEVLVSDCAQEHSKGEWPMHLRAQHDRPRAGGA